MADNYSTRRHHDRGSGLKLKDMARMVDLLAIVTAIVYLFGLLDNGVTGGQATSWLLALLLVGTVGLLLAWLWPAPGATAALLAGIALVFVVARSANMTSGLVTGSPFLVAGILWLLDWTLHRRSQPVARASR